MVMQFRDLIENAPSAPGIYKMFDAEDNLLYVGKAKNLSNRLKQYIDVSKLENHKQVMRSLVQKVEWEITPTENDALLLEEKLIKTLKPKYNVMLTDGKMYPMLSITKHTYPRLLKFRGNVSHKPNIYGPYPSVSALNETIKIIQQVCQLRTCNDSFMKNRSRPCLLHQIGRCSAPCILPQANYDENVKLAHKILKGDSEVVISHLTKQMQKYSAQQDYESAAQIRDKISVLTKTTTQYVQQGQPSNSDLKWHNNLQLLEQWLNLKLSKVGVFDNSHLFGKTPVGAMIAFGHKGFIKTSYRHFKLQDKKRAGNDIAMMEEFIARAIKDIPDLDLIIVDGGKAQWNIAKKTSSDIPVLGVAKGIVRNGDEHFIMPDGTENYSLDKNSALFLLLRAVRDEAHRFVITYHRTSRAKTFTSSCLDEIEGIGPTRKKYLLQHYGSIRSIMDASLQSLSKVPKLGKHAAKKIYDYFHSNMI